MLALRAEASASGLTSASCYHVEENIFVIAIVEVVLKLREVQRQIFFAHVVIGAEHAALQKRPERWEGLGVRFLESFATPAPSFFGELLGLIKPDFMCCSNAYEPASEGLHSPRSPEVGEHPGYSKKTTFDGTKLPMVEDRPTTTTYGMDHAAEASQAGADLKNSSTAFTYSGSLGALR